MKPPTVFLVLAIFATLGAQCNPPSPPAVAKGGPRVWIDAPRHGSTIPLAPYEVVSHSSDPLQVVRVELSVNGAVLRTDPNPEMGKSLATMRQQWTPPAPGNYTLMVRAQNSTGVWGEYARAVVTIVGGTITPVTLTPVPPVRVPPTTVAPPPIPFARTPTRTPTRTTTPAVPPPPAGCSGTPNIGSLSASPATIAVGQSATLSWAAVTNADSVSIEPGIGGIATPGSTTVSPTQTTTYTLTARCGTNVQTRLATVTVQTRVVPPPPQDTTGPTISDISASPYTFYRTGGCGAVAVTVRAHVTDPSGVANVTLWYRVGSSGSFTSASMSFVYGDFTGYSRTVNASEVPGANIGTWQFYITAQDARGNTSTSPTNTSVTLSPCNIIK